MRTDSRILAGAVLVFVVVAVVACADSSGDAGPGSSPTTTPEGAAPSISEPTSTEESAPAEPRFATSEAFTAHVEAVAGTADDGPFYMVNLLDFADTAHYPEDSEFFGTTGLEANQRYTAAAEPAIAAVGGERVFVGGVTETLIGDGTEWDVVAVVRYPSRQSVVDLSDNALFAAAVEHKWASLDHTLAIVTESQDLGPVAMLPAVDFATVPHPPTEDDPAFMMFHLIDFRETAQYEPGEEPDDGPISGREAVARYSENAGQVAGPLGIRPFGWFDVVVPAVTDGRTWDEVRLNPFPSRATFEALTGDPTWEAGAYHRSAGIEDTYALMLAPIIWETDVLAGQPRG